MLILSMIARDAANKCNEVQIGNSESSGWMRPTDPSVTVTAHHLLKMFAEEHRERT